jgi:hypothetical protein
MSHSSFNSFTDDERQGIHYAACIGGAALSNVVVKRGSGGDVVLVETAARAAFALMAAKRLSPATRQKLLLRSATLLESEIMAALDALLELQPALTKFEALRVLAAARMEIAHNPARYRVII